MPSLLLQKIKKYQTFLYNGLYYACCWPLVEFRTEFD